MSRNSGNVKILIYIFPLFLILYQIQCSYFKSLQLASRNILYVNETGIYLFDEDFNYKSNVKIFDNLLNEYEIHYSSLSQYSANDGGYIVCKIQNTFYLFSDDLSYKCEKNQNLTFADNSIIAHFKKEEDSNQNFYFLFCYVEGAHSLIYIIEYYFTKNSGTCTLNKKMDNSFQPLGSSTNEQTSQPYLFCDLIYNDTLGCFNINNYPPELSANLINLENGFSKMNSNYCYYGQGYANFVKSTLSPDKKRELVCYYSGGIYCSIYDIENNQYSNLVTVIGNALRELDNFSVQYFSQTNEYIIAGIGYGNYLEMVTLDENFKVKSNNNSLQICYTKINAFSNCSSVVTFHILYSETKKNYEVIFGCKDVDNYMREMNKCNMELNFEIDFFNGTNETIIVPDKTNNTSNKKDDKKDDNIVENDIIESTTNLTKKN